MLELSDGDSSSALSSEDMLDALQLRAGVF